MIVDFNPVKFSVVNLPIAVIITNTLQSTLSILAQNGTVETAIIDYTYAR